MKKNSSISVVVRPAARYLIAAALVAGSAALPLGAASAAEATSAGSTAAPKGVERAEAAITKGLAYLKTQQQADGDWNKPNEPPALSALALKAFILDSHIAANKEVIDKAMARLATFEKPDGSVGDILVTYNTAIVVSAFATAKDPKYKESLDKALAYLRGLQWTDQIQGVSSTGRKTDPSDINYGGWDYGQRKGRADLSNVQMALDALHDAGMKPDDPAYQAALKFVTRSQNLSETNPQQPWVGDDGGFIYTPAEGGRSAAGEDVDAKGRRTLRSYGAMSYAGLKSMMYAGLSKDDPRVKGAWKWVSKNWTVEDHPGMAEANPKNANAGIFYYYHTLARALHAYGEPIIIDSKGVKHDWRLELIDKLATTQNADGSWVGTQRWMESRPALSTALGVLSLEEALADLKEHPAQ